MKIGINPKDLLDYIIMPTLGFMEMGGRTAENLLLGTAAQESCLGHFLKQTKGPALGIYQIEPATHLDIYENYLYYNNDILKKVNSFARLDTVKERENELISNLDYATVIARLIYYRVKQPLPIPGSGTHGLANYWKHHYNTIVGKGKIEDFIYNYDLYIRQD